MSEFFYSCGGDLSHAASLDRIHRLKAGNPAFTLVDIGASDNPWTASLVTAIVDLKPSNVGVVQFTGNINEVDIWNKLLDHVYTRGKFSFSVCSHTLEDIAYPALALRVLPLISEAGLISTPSHMRELTRNLEGPWRGYIHHRWMYRERNRKLLAIPKVSFIEYTDLPSRSDPDKAELQMWWEGSLDFEVLNNDYLGPNVQVVKNMYEENLR
jgi:hypothetical protein